MNILTTSYQKNSDYFLEGFSEFCEFINAFQFPEHYVIISLDVKALFNDTFIQRPRNSKEKYQDEVSKIANLISQHSSNQYNFFLIQK